jgi:hypothetical protein
MIKKLEMNKEEKFVFCERYCKSCPHFHDCISEDRCIQDAVKKYFIDNYRKDIKDGFF